MFIDSPLITGSLTSTDQFVVPFGISGSQTTNPRSGSLHLNLTDDKLITFNGNAWVNVGAAAEEAGPYNVEYLSVAGGGAGGYRGQDGTYYNGGGGAGGLVTSTYTSVAIGTTLTITIGAGGAQYAGAAVFGNGSNGSNSSLSGTSLTTVTTIGGGRGAAINHPVSDAAVTNQNGQSGGSGGGATGWNNVSSTGGAGTAGQGNAGGNGSPAEDAGGSGGGGAGGVGTGSTGTANRDGGNGGAGFQSSITGTATYYAVGARGGRGYSGGAGNDGADGTGYSAASNTGNGGQPGIPTSIGTNTSGNSGVTVIKILTSNYSGTTTGSPTVTTDGDYTIIKFTSSGTYTT